MVGVPISARLSNLFRYRAELRFDNPYRVDVRLAQAANGAP